MAVVALLAVTMLRIVPPIWDLAVNSPRLPQWDMAKYGVSGLRLTRTVQEFDLLALLQQLNRLDTWPPVFPLLEVPFFLVAGPGYASPRALVALLFAVAVAAAFWSGTRSTAQWGLAVGALTSALVASSPMTQLFATIVMLEIPGVALLLLAVGLYTRSLTSERARDFTFACLAATTLFFCKFNYGLMWILALVASELLRRHYLREVLSPGLARRLGVLLRRPWPAVVAGGLLLATIIELAGPWRFTVARRVVSVSSSGPLLYALYAAFLLSRLLRPRRSLDVARQWFSSLDSRARSAVATIALPIGLWMVMPSHTVEFVGFLVNRSVGPPLSSLKNLLFYPRVFIDQYCASPAVGVVVLAFGACSLHRLRGSDEAGRVLAVALLTSSILAVLHPHKQPRFFVIAAALLWLAGSREAVKLAARAWRGADQRAQRWTAALIAVAGLAAAAMVAVDVDRLEQDHRRHTVEATTREVLAAITDRAQEAQSSVLLGTWNRLSPWLVEWSCLQRGSSIARSQVPYSPAGRRHHDDVVAWLVTSSPELIMVLSAVPDTAPRAGFVAETSWLDPLRRRLPRDRRFLRTARMDFANTGYRLETFVPARTGADHVPR